MLINNKPETIVTTLAFISAATTVYKSLFLFLSSIFFLVYMLVLEI